MVRVSQIQINYQENPTGISSIEQIGWKIISNESNVFQLGYELQISKDEEFKVLIYNSGQVKSGESTHIEVEDLSSRLKSSKKYYIRVKVETTVGNSTWKTGFFVTALLDAKEWKAQFITIEKEDDKAESKGSYVRTLFCAKKRVKAVYAYATALGIYHLYINGTKVGEDEFAPGWTSYNKHLLYQTYDVTDFIKIGNNVIAAHVGAGWYKGTMGFSRLRNHYGEKSAFACQIHLEYEDGSCEDISTGKEWNGRWSPVLFSEFYDGEIYDSRMETDGWNQLEGKKLMKEEWKTVDIVSFPREVLRPQSGSRVKKIEKLCVKEIITTPKGETVLDFGQNMTGFVEFKVTGKNGSKVVLNCFEVLDQDGNVYRDNLRSAKQTITYICNGRGEQIYHPNFSFQGFRYVSVAEYAGHVQAENFSAYVVHSEMKRTGSFVCSNPDLNQLHHNILWGMKGNFLDVPTDCPQRDERLGWTGDAQIFSRTATYLMDTYTFYRKWLKDLSVDQLEEGGVPHVIPDIVVGKSSADPLMKDGEHSASAWADAAVIIPWVLYTMYGDKNIIRYQYKSMKAWVDFMKSHSIGNIWNYQLQFGDWVALDAEEGSYYGATPNDLTCMAFYAHSAELLSKMAYVIGEIQDAETYRQLADSIKKTYQELFISKAGRLNVQTQTAQILTLAFELVPKEYEDNLVKDLLALLEKEDGHLVTGFVGTPYFCKVLSKHYCLKEAYELLLKDDFPSWLYQVKKGATTIWEHWDGIKPDGTMWSADMNSFNHYAYGAVGEWLYRTIGGIDYDEQEPGFKRFLIEPHIGGNLKFAEVSYESIYGTIVSRWETEGEKVYLQVEIPCNTTALISPYGIKKIWKTGGLKFIQKDGKYIAEAGSGKYEIVFNI